MISKKIRLVNEKNNQAEFNEEDLRNAPDGFFEEISVLDVLETSSSDNVMEEITHKIRKNGILKLSGVDALDMCRQVYYGEIPMEEASAHFFSHAKRLNSLVSIKDYFVQKGWKVKFAGMSSGRYLVEAQRS